MLQLVKPRNIPSHYNTKSVVLAVTYIRLISTNIWSFLLSDNHTLLSCSTPHEYTCLGSTSYLEANILCENKRRFHVATTRSTYLHISKYVERVRIYTYCQTYICLVDLSTTDYPCCIFESCPCVHYARFILRFEFGYVRI